MAFNNPNSDDSGFDRLSLRSSDGKISETTVATNAPDVTKMVIANGYAVRKLGRTLMQTLPQDTRDLLTYCEQGNVDLDDTIKAFWARLMRYQGHVGWLRQVCLPSLRVQSQSKT